jgi:hypothetical protein
MTHFSEELRQIDSLYIHFIQDGQIPAEKFDAAYVDSVDINNQALLMSIAVPTRSETQTAITR